jgi:hypothetical protein
LRVLGTAIVTGVNFVVEVVVEATLAEVLTSANGAAGAVVGAAALETDDSAATAACGGASVFIVVVVVVVVVTSVILNCKVNPLSFFQTPFKS